MDQRLDRLKFAWRFLLLPRARVASANSEILRALTETMWDVASPGEARQTQRIEQYRSALTQDESEVEFLDYGAGSRDNQFSGEDLRRGVGSRKKISEIALASKSALWGRLLHKIVRLTAAKSCVEMGTSLAISASYIASGLGRDGRLVTMEGAPAVADLAADTLRRLVPDREVEICVGPFHDTLDAVLEKAAPIDFAFVDGNHERTATESYHRQLLRHMQPGGVMVFDDIRWSADMLRAWKTIRADSRGTCLDLGNVGIVLLA